MSSRYDLAVEDGGVFSFGWLFYGAVDIKVLNWLFLLSLATAR